MKKTFFFLALIFTTNILIAQSQVEYSPVNITINIPDYVVNGLTINKRTATCEKMIYDLKQKTVTVYWCVKNYLDSNGNYGSYLAPQISDYIIKSIADNDTKVSMQGAILIADSTGNYNVDYLGQYDWFNMIGQSTPIVVNDMIRQYGQLVSNWNKRN